VHRNRKAHRPASDLRLAVHKLAVHKQRRVVSDLRLLVLRAVSDLPLVVHKLVVHKLAATALRLLLLVATVHQHLRPPIPTVLRLVRRSRLRQVSSINP
jgi:hypothetical protein